MLKNATRLALVCLLLGAGPVLAVGSEDNNDMAIEAAQGMIDREDHAGAIAKLASVVATDPMNADAWNLLGFASRKLGKMDDAAKYYKTALEIDPDHLGALEYQGEMFIEIGQPEAALANLEKLKAACGDCHEMQDLMEALQAAGLV